MVPRTAVLLGLFVSAVLFLPDAAKACRAGYGGYERWGRDKGDFEAEVEVTKYYGPKRTEDEKPDIAFEARVIKIIRGNISTNTVRIMREPCTGRPSLGRQLVLMGCIRSLENATATISVFGRPSLYIPADQLPRDCPPT